MSAKQDRQGVRTATDLERKYKFGESFAEVFGIATDAQKTANAAKDSIGVLNGNLDHNEIFNRLTKNGELEGIYRGDDGEIYINASYIASGIISSKDGKIQIDLTGETDMPVFNTGISTNGISVRGDEVNAPLLFEIVADKDDVAGYFSNMKMYNTEGACVAELTETVGKDGAGFQLTSEDGSLSAIMQASGSSAGLRLLKDGSTLCYLAIDSSGKAVLSGVTGLSATHIRVDKINDKAVSWKDNGDGTYTLIGT